MSKIVKLNNGVKVANFSTAHDFRFDDGSVLPRVPTENVRKYSINIFEDGEVEPQGRFQDILLQPRLTRDVREKIKEYQDMYQKGEIDIVICPIVMLNAMKLENIDIKNSPFRSVRRKDKITKEVWSSKFCI